MPAKLQWKTDPELIELMNFLIERTKDSKSLLNVSQLIEEFKEKTGSSQEVRCLSSRIYRFLQKIHKFDSVDTETKVRILFALSASVDEDFLEELQKEADVEVDGNNRITKYKAKNGGLNLEGDHSHSAKVKEALKQKKRGKPEDSDDASKNSTPKTPGSVKRSAPEVENSSKKPRTSSPNHSARIRESRSREQPPKIQQLRQPKLEETSGARSRQEAPGAHIPRATPIKTEPGVDVAYTSRIKFLETLHSLVLNLDTLSLFSLKTKIDEKLRESPNVKITNDEIIPAIEFLVAKIAKHSMLNLAENVESVRFSDFLCYLKSAILNSKLEGLEVLLETIKDRIKEPASKDK
ncbi:unnamed protein product, partial [Caenorhabditis brenneri]